MSDLPANLISRQEASHRLKIISARVNAAVSATREGHWGEAAKAAAEARHFLDTLIPHLDEAAEVETQLVGSLGYNPPVPDKPKRTGGMGYRGSSHNRGPVVEHSRETFAEQATRIFERGSSAPPKPIDLPKPEPRVFAMPPVGAQEQSAPEPQPEPEVIRFESVTFDLSRIPGTSAWHDGIVTAETLTLEEAAVAEHYYRLSDALQKKIEARWAATGQPVTVKLRPVEVKVGAHDGR
jgi:hypothetical protein